MEKKPQSPTHHQYMELKGSYTGRDGCGQRVQGASKAQVCKILVGLRSPDHLDLSSLSPALWPEKIRSPEVEPYRISRS